MHSSMSKAARLLCGIAVSVIVIGFLIPSLKFTSEDLCTASHRAFEAGVLLCGLTIIAGHTAQFGDRKVTDRKPLAIPLIAAYVFGLFALNLAIPPLDGGCGSRAWWNERTASRAMRNIVTAQATYREQYPTVGYACSVRFLGRPAGSEPSSASAAGLVDDVLAEGLKSGFSYRLSCGSGRQSYSVVAFPVVPRETGNFAYCADQSGVIRQIDQAKWQSCQSSGTVVP
jgi:hypothetical protein